MTVTCESLRTLPVILDCTLLHPQRFKVWTSLAYSTHKLAGRYTVCCPVDCTPVNNVANVSDVIVAQFAMTACCAHVR